MVLETAVPRPLGKLLNRLQLPRVESANSRAIGEPGPMTARLTTRPMQTCLQSGRLSREWPRCACGFAFASPSKYVEVTSYNNKS